MLSVIVLGFKTEDIIQIPEIAWAFHDPSISAGLSGREYVLIIEKWWIGLMPFCESGR